jgi:hypothetical protein
MAVFVLDIKSCGEKERLSEVEKANLFFFLLIREISLKSAKVEKANLYGILGKRNSTIRLITYLVKLTYYSTAIEYYTSCIDIVVI